MRQNGGRERKKHGKQRKVKNSYMTLAVLSGVCIFALEAFLLAFVLKEKKRQEETDRLQWTTERIKEYNHVKYH